MVRWPGRLVRGLLRASLACAGLAFLLPLLASLWSPYAVHVQSPVRPGTLPEALRQGPDLRAGHDDRRRLSGGHVTLADAARDPWGEPYRVLPGEELAPGDWVVYSSGPNGRDELGEGDDLRVDGAAPRFLSRARWRLGALALLCCGLALLAELAGPPQSERLGREVLRAAALALAPGALCVAYLLSAPTWLRTLVAPLEPLLFLPLPISAALLGAALSFLVALRYRTWREPAAEHERWPGVRRRRRAWAVTLLGLLVAAAGFAWDLRRERAHERACVLALAQLGGHNAITNLGFRVYYLQEGQEELRRFLAHAPSGHAYDRLATAALKAMNAEGELALEVLLGALPRTFDRPDPELAAYLRRYDPSAEGLAARFDADERPAMLLGTLLEFEQELLARWGRRGMIERLLSLAEDPAFGTHPGFEDVLALAVDLCGAAGAAQLGADRSSSRAYRAWRRRALLSVREWVRRQETLPPRWWLTLRTQGSPPVRKTAVQMELRVHFADGASRQIHGRGELSLDGRHSFARRPSSLEVLANDEWKWLVPLDLPAGDVALRVELPWGEEAKVQQWAIPAR